jgi:hypothetical protein
MKLQRSKKHAVWLVVALVSCGTAIWVVFRMSQPDLLGKWERHTVLRPKGGGGGSAPPVYLEFFPNGTVVMDGETGNYSYLEKGKNSVVRVDIRGMSHTLDVVFLPSGDGISVSARGVADGAIGVYSR